MMANIPWWGWALMLWAVWAIWYWRRPTDEAAPDQVDPDAGGTAPPPSPAWWRRFLPLKAAPADQPPRRLDRFQTELLEACGNDQERADRMIAYERKKNAALTREDAAESAMERLEREKARERAKSENLKSTATA